MQNQKYKYVLTISVCRLHILHRILKIWVQTQTRFIWFEWGKIVQIFTVCTACGWLVSHYLTCFFLLRVMRGPEPIPACIGRDAGIHPEQVTDPSQGAHTIHTLQMYVLCGRKPEYPEEPHADTGRSCELHAERPWPQFGQGPSRREATVLFTAPLCRLFSQRWMILLELKLKAPNYINNMIRVTTVKCDLLGWNKAFHTMKTSDIVIWYAWLYPPKPRCDGVAMGSMGQQLRWDIPNRAANKHGDQQWCKIATAMLLSHWSSYIRSSAN